MEFWFKSEKNWRKSDIEDFFQDCGIKHIHMEVNYKRNYFIQKKKVHISFFNKEGAEKAEKKSKDERMADGLAICLIKEVQESIKKQADRKKTRYR